MINEFWNLVLETWQQGIRGTGIYNIIICLLIILGSLVARGNPLYEAGGSIELLEEIPD